MRPAAILGLLACGMTVAMWLRLGPFLDTGLGPGIGLVAGSLMAGPLIDRRSQKAVAVAGLALLAAALWCLLAGLMAQPWIWLWPGALGMGGAMAFLGVNALTSAGAAENPAVALNLLNLLLPVGVLLNPLLSPVNMVRAATAMATVALVFTARTPMPAPGPREDGGRQKRTSILLLALLLFLYVVCEAGTWNWLVRYLDAARVLDRETAWLVLSFGLPLGLIVGRIGASRMLRNVRPLTVARNAAFAMAFTTALMLLARSPSAAWIAGFCVGVAMSPVLPTTLAVAWGAWPRLPATGMGLVLAAGWIGLSSSSPLIARIAEHSSLPLAMLALPVLSLAMAAVATTMRRGLAKGSGLLK